MAFNEILKRSISWSKVSTSVIILLSLSCFHSEIPFDFCYEKLIFRSGYIFSELLSLVRCVIRGNYWWHWVTLSPLCDIFLYIIFLKFYTNNKNFWTGALQCRQVFADITSTMIMRWYRYLDRVYTPVQYCLQGDLVSYLLRLYYIYHGEYTLFWFFYGLYSNRFWNLWNAMTPDRKSCFS